MIRTGALFRAYAASPIGVERDEHGRVWTQVFPLETWHRADFPGGKLDLTPSLMAEFIANWKAAGSPPLPVDYEHKEDGPASGWMEALRINASGILQAAIKWTDEAAEDIKADRRRFLSPTWAMQHTNRRTGAKGGPWLYGAGLTNSPFFDSMPRVAAAAQPKQDSPQHPKGNTMNEAELKALRAKLKLADDATPEQIIEAANPKDDSAEKLTAAVKSQTDAEAKLTAATSEIATLKASLEKEQGERFSEQVTQLVAEAKREGRPVDALIATSVFKATKDIADVKALIASVAPSVPVKTTGTPGKAEPKTQADAKREYDALVAEEQKKGSAYTEAARLVARNHPELSKLVFSNPTTN